MKNKFLVNWYQDNKITFLEKERLKKIGLDDSFTEYTLNDLKKILQNEASFIKLEKEIIGKIRSFSFFSTWFCNDCVIVIDEMTLENNNKEANYGIWLWIHEPNYREFGERQKTFKIADNQICFNEAKRKAIVLRLNLQKNSPIININLPLEIKYYEREKKMSPEMSLVGKATELLGDLSDPDQYIKPLDIVKVYKLDNSMLHSGIYLGSKKITHAIPNSSSHSSYSSYYSGYYGGYYSYLPTAGYYGSIGNIYNKPPYNSNNDNISKGGMIEIIDWQKFLNFWGDESGKTVRISTFIPLKNSEDIIRHIAKANISSDAYFKKKEFEMTENNCEHFVNRCVLGLDFSEHAEIKKKVRKQKFESHELKKEIKKTRSFLNNLTDSELFIIKVDEIKEYMSITPNKVGQSFDTANIQVIPEQWYK